MKDIPLEGLGTSAQNSPPHPGKIQIPYPMGTEDSQMPVGWPERGEDVEASNSAAY